MTLEASVPGNLLLAGEYAVLEPGGLGITVAVERRVRLRVGDSPELEIAGTWGDGPARWSAERPEGSALFDAVVKTACRGRELPQVLVEVDSSAFFLAPDRKIGYGSSAAVAVAVTAALLRAMAGRAPEAEEVFPLALAAHRAFQGGRGSGYDVATSLHGGTGLFAGGEAPTWRPAALHWLHGAVVFRGTRSVATSGATARYRAWKEREPEAARRFLEESTRLVRDLLAAQGAAAREPFLRLRDTGLRLGEAIGVSAAIEPPDELREAGGMWKALGAGDEIGVYLPERPMEPLSGERLVVAERGLQWLP